MKIRFVCFLKMMSVGHALDHVLDHILDHMIKGFKTMPLQLPSFLAIAPINKCLKSYLQ